MEETRERAPSVIDRYYTRWYKTGVSSLIRRGPVRVQVFIPTKQEPHLNRLKAKINWLSRWNHVRLLLDMKGRSCEDHCVLQHSNRICIITLAESHPILRQGRKIKSIDYRISDGCSRLNNKVSGKSKRGGQFLTEFAPLCRITCTDDAEYTVFSCIRGRLLEVNEDILKRPDLLLEKPSTDGYIAVILPKLEESKTVTKGLLTREQYEDVVSKRRTQPQESH